jgi:hypothetical protein
MPELSGASSSQKNCMGDDILGTTMSGGTGAGEPEFN